MKRPRRIYRGWWIVLAGLVALIVNGGATSYVFSLLVAPMERDLGWSRAAMYGAITFMGVVSGMVAGPMGPLFDRYGARTLMALSAVLGGACLMLVAFVGESWQFYALIGVGVALSRPALQLIGARTAVANWFVRKRPQAFAWLSIGWPLAGVVFVPPVAWMVAALGWRSVWFTMGLLHLVVVLPLSWAAVRRRPEELGLLPDGDSPEEAAARAASGPARRPEGYPWSRGEALRTRAFWLLVLGFLCSSFPGSSIFLHLVPFFQDRGLSVGEAGSLLSAYAGSAILGRLIWSNVITRWGPQRSLVVWACAYGLGIIAYLLPTYGLALVVSTVVLGAIVGGSPQLQAQVWPDYYGRDIVGALTGYMTFFITPAVAGGPLLAAVMYDATGSYQAVFTIYCGLCFLAALFYLLARRPAPPRGMRYEG